MPTRRAAAPEVRVGDGTDGTGAADARFTDVVEHLGGALAEAGLSRLPARVFAALMATEDGRLTAADLARVLEVSPAGVSGAVGYLLNVRMIRRERERGSRRDVYVVLDDAWHDVLMQKDQIYAPILAALLEARDEVGAGSRAGERMQLSVEFLEFVQREMDDLARRWDEYKASRAASS
ncbi:GbsR/MarR family transcriptional regulator [Oryzobacter telluris]|uniref:GbsR/MarR family transcriptional regulator n=1 Tax=Oryzobacter telluris TaxID=3149179 RepID=UPI00370D75FC